MALYMTQFSYTTEALAAMVKNPQNRSAILQELVEQMGGRLVGFFLCFGEYDGVAITDVPDRKAELALILSAMFPGHLKAIKTTPLFSMDEAVEAMERAACQDYTGPEDHIG